MIPKQQMSLGQKIAVLIKKSVYFDRARGETPKIFRKILDAVLEELLNFYEPTKYKYSKAEKKFLCFRRAVRVRFLPPRSSDKKSTKSTEWGFLVC